MVDDYPGIGRERPPRSEEPNPARVRAGMESMERRAVCSLGHDPSIPLADLIADALVDNHSAETVNHPSHYGGADNPFETIKVLKAWMPPEAYLGFLVGNALKYLSRAGKKGSETEDYAKAAWYAQEAAKQAKEMGR